MSEGIGTIKEIQDLLLGYGYKLRADGRYDIKTIDAVKAYQAKHGITITGLVDDKTWASLQAWRQSHG